MHFVLKFSALPCEECCMLYEDSHPEFLKERKKTMNYNFIVLGKGSFMAFSTMLFNIPQKLSHSNFFHHKVHKQSHNTTLTPALKLCTCVPWVHKHSLSWPYFHLCSSGRLCGSQKCTHRSRAVCTVVTRYTGKQSDKINT